MAKTEIDCEVKATVEVRQANILILTVTHGASHTQTAKALKAAFGTIEPYAQAGVLDALSLCTGWFRAYYDSYLILLKSWPKLWSWIEAIQHKSQATGPGWLYRWGARPLVRYLQSADPDIVVATEVGMCELAVLMKRHYKMNFLLAASCGLDVDRAWVQPEVDVFIVPPGDAVEQILAAGAPASKVHVTGVPVNPAFATLPSRPEARLKLGLRDDLPVLLVLFGGAGFGDPALILPQLQKIDTPVQTVFVAGNNAQLRNVLERYSQSLPYSRVCGWVENIHEWMAAADLLLSKPGASTVNEAITAGLPLVAFDPLPGNERRLCDNIERWDVGRWARHADDISEILNHLLSHPEARLRLRAKAQAMALPHAAYDAAEAIMNSWVSSLASHLAQEPEDELHELTRRNI